MSGSPRSLMIVADDFGIGPETSRGILDCAERGLLSGTVLIVNARNSVAAVDAWKRRGRPIELGWHPNLTLDAPILGTRVPTLIGPSGQFHRLGTFVRRLMCGQIAAAEIAAELRAQRDRFVELVGRVPGFVNSHQHIAVFPPVGRILLDLLAEQAQLPVVRRVCEPRPLLVKVPGARVKRILLDTLGRRLAKTQEAKGFPGTRWLLGITDPAWVQDPDYFPRWLRSTQETSVELMVHPGYEDATLIGRDAEPGDDLVRRRVDELARMMEPSFLDAVGKAGFTMRRPSDFSEACRRAA